MASSLKNLSTYDENQIPDLSSYHFGIVVADWNEHITHALYQGALDTLLKHGGNEKQIHVIQVPGAFELTQGCRHLITNHKLDSVIGLGCVIKGETSHNEYINQAVAHGLTNLGLSSGIPCIFGLLTPNDEQQALDRAGGKYGNKGVEAAITAIRMAELKRNSKVKQSKIGF